MKRSPLLILLVLLATACSRTKAPVRVANVTSSSPGAQTTPTPTPTEMQNQQGNNNSSSIGPRIELNVQNTIDFPVAFPNQDSNFTVLVRNTGDASAALPVSVAGAGLAIATSSCGVELAARSACQINLVFKGDTNRSAQLRIGGATIVCTLRIQVPQVKLLTLNENVLADGFTFTTIPVNNVETRAFLLRNDGNAPADLSGLFLRGSASFSISSTANCSAKYANGKLPPQGICAVEIRYAPITATEGQELNEMIFQTPWNEVRARLFGRAFPAVKAMNVVWGRTAPGHHIYTSSEGERDYLRTHGFTDGLDLPNTEVTVPFFYHTEQVAGTVPIYRLSHRNGPNILTLDPGHRDGLANSGDWTLNSQPAAFLYATAPASERVPSNAVYHLYLHANGDHYYTENIFERESLKSRGWEDHGILGYAPVFYARAEVFNVTPLAGGSAQVAWSAANAEDCTLIAWAISPSGTVENSTTLVANGLPVNPGGEVRGLRPSGNRLLLRCRIGLPATAPDGTPARVFNVHQMLFQN